MKLARNLLLFLLVFLNSFLFSQSKETEKEINSALIHSSLEHILKKVASKFDILSSSNFSDITKIDSSRVYVTFSKDSSRLNAEAIVYSQDKQISISMSERLVDSGLLNKIKKVNSSWAEVDSLELLHFIQKHKIPLIKQLKYRPGIYVRARYKAFLKMTGPFGLLAFLDEQFKRLAQREKENKKYTGLVIDLRNFYVEATPLVNIKCGKFTIFSPEIVNRDIVIKQGMVLWAKNLQKNEVCSRIGNEPLILTPVKIINGSTLILEEKFSGDLTKPYFKELLKNCSVVILN
ncbi:hypothetical protein B6D60_02015 [candidate division KSB1 bacterium 4484_87]|nr:MAG: hypothetical protein B6D60_02015 [candidate division KSB1 bacterium 4484_87]